MKIRQEPQFYENCTLALCKMGITFMENDLCLNAKWTLFLCNFDINFMKI